MRTCHHQYSASVAATMVRFVHAPCFPDMQSSVELAGLRVLCVLGRQLQRHRHVKG